MNFRRSALFGVLAALAAGCSAGKTVIIEAKGTSIYLKGASADATRRVMDAANARIAKLEVAPIVAAARAGFSAPEDRIEIARGKGNFASKDPLSAGAVLSFESRGQDENAPTASLPAGRDLRGQLHMKILPWPHVEGGVAHPNLLLPQAEVDAVMDRGLTEKGVAFAKRIVSEALKRQEEVLVEEAERAGFKTDAYR